MDKQKLSKGLEDLAREAAGKEGRLEMTRVLDYFQDCQPTPEEMEEVSITP